MTEPTLRQCPYLGLAADRGLTSVEPSRGHRCYAQQPPAMPDLPHQAGYCLVAAHRECPFYAAAVAAGVDAEPAPAWKPPRAAPARWPRMLLWGALALALVAVVALYWLDLSGRAVSSLWSPGASDVAGVTSQPTAMVVSTPEPPPAAQTTADDADPATAPPARTAEAAQPVAAQATRVTVPTAEPGGRVLTLTPAAGEAGWWSSEDERGNHLGDSYLYAGYFGGQAFVAAARFDLSDLPRGAPIREAILQLTGLEAGRFDPAAGGTWSLHLLADDAIPNYERSSFQEVFNAPPAAALFPTLYPADLEKGRANVLAFDATARAWLEQQLLDGATAVIVRITGPGSGETLFAWDSGAGPATVGEAPRLILDLAAPPPTVPPLPTEAVIVATLTPTPANVLTAAADAWTATAVAQTVGTYTPLPFRAVTPTPLPENIATLQANALLAGLPPIVPHTPTPANEATATADALIASAFALLTGTPTATPEGAVTPIIILPTPQPENVMTQAAHYVQATLAAGQTATPLPYNAILATLTPTPPVIQYTPQPANRATVDFQVAYATAVAVVVGTFTPIPPNFVTPTATGQVVAPPPTLALPPPAAATPALTGTPTAVPPPERAATPTATTSAGQEVPLALIEQSMDEANATLVALIEDPEAARDTLRAYFCGPNAWGKVTSYLDSLPGLADPPTNAEYAVSDRSAPVRGRDGRWQLQQSESWTYTYASGRQATSRERYTYWLTAPSSGTPAFCIDDFTYQVLR